MHSFRFARRLICGLSILCAPFVRTTGADEVLCDAKGVPVKYAGKLSSAKVIIPRQYTPAAAELRGVWAATVENLDFPPCASAEEYMKNFRIMVDKLAAARFNALFFQIRPTCDAFYPSKLNAWSGWLTGTPGRGIPNFDPLRFMIAESKKRNIEFHAWLNPYRVINKTKLSKAAYLATLPPTHFAAKNPQLVLEVPNGNGTNLLFLNPGEPAVIDYVVATVREIVVNYDVESIHFDDYFYPYTKFGDIDAAAYRKYARGEALAVWRRNNVTTLIRRVKTAIAEQNRRSGRNVEFGVSPFGIWANRKDMPGGSLTAGSQSYVNQFADTRLWVKNRYIDYILPQLYWPFGHDAAAYAALTDWWAGEVRGTGVKLYTGLAVYQLGRGALWQDPMELANQLRYNNKHPEIKGAVFFRYQSVFAPENAIMRAGVSRVLNDYWKRPARPLFPAFQ